MSSTPIVIHKFGGTSLADAPCIERAAALISQQKKVHRVIVVSAMKGVTNTLIACCEKAQNQDKSYSEDLQSLLDNHLKTAQQLLKDSPSEEFINKLTTDTHDLGELLKGVYLAKNLPEATLEMIVGYGELWSSQLFAEHLKSLGESTSALDTREFLTIEKGEVGPLVDWSRSQSLLKKINPLKDTEICVATGFIAVNKEGLRTTLGRNGSDYSASILGRLFSAQSVTIWTDVNGIYSADPRHVPEAQLIEHLTYKEAMELAYFGAKVLHPHTMGPIIEQKIELCIRNTFNPACSGTKISEVRPQRGLMVKGFATVDNVCLLNLEGSGMIGVPGVAQRLFGSLREVGVSVTMISQASSEHSICLAVPNEQKQKAEEAIRESFAQEFANGKIQSLQALGDSTILAAVGDNMVDTPGVAGKFFASLGRSGVNVRAIAQGSSERNISVVIESEHTTKALRAVHSAFYLSNFTLSVGLIGPGVIGKTLLQQIREQTSELNIDLRVRGIANSKHMLLHEESIDLSAWQDEFSNCSNSLQLNEFAQHIQAEHIPHAVIIDSTASEEVAKNYEAWLRQGIHVITPNKKASSAPIDDYERLLKQIHSRQGLFFYEATVGAGLPIISSLKDLVETGDEILKIEGILSGTLSHIFNSFDGQTPFSQIVKEAKEQGFTEPDPRDDLSGLDVARKIVILAREAGFNTDLSQIPVEGLMPKGADPQLSIDDFMAALPDMDEDMKSLWLEAEQKDEVLRYVGSIDKSGQAQVGVRRFSKNHAFARITGTDNIIAFTTQRYLKQPLVVQGPGAGPDVTAAGVFADLLRLANHLGAQTL